MQDLQDQRSCGDSAMTRERQKSVLVYRMMLAAAFGAISYLATTSRHFPVVEKLSDKLNHIAAFYVLGLLTDRSWPGTRSRSLLALILLGYGLSIEIVQHFLPYRTFSLYDLGADAVGLALYAASIQLVRQWNS
jgi:VanZ family protein